MHKLTLPAKDVWFTSDTHYGHNNILRYCDRPFETIDAHDEALLNNAWETVGEGGVLVHLGDVVFGRVEKARAVTSRLPGGLKILVAGNHDYEQTLEAPDWDMVVPYLELKLQLEGREVLLVLSHYPFEIWNKSHHGALHLHGHSHGSLPALLKEAGGRLDVGVDAWDFRPIQLSDIEKRLKQVRQNRHDGRAPYAIRKGRYDPR